MCIDILYFIHKLKSVKTIVSLCHYVHALVTYSDGLGKAACKKKFAQSEEPSALHWQ